MNVKPILTFNKHISIYSYSTTLCFTLSYTGIKYISITLISNIGYREKRIIFLVQVQLKEKYYARQVQARLQFEPMTSNS